ncbi:MAG TPA: copper resistance protein CopC, partial [Thermomicrobiaceae bacterium]|nr:copper resistance protein CopC [Thermomicrobiaceae bacterium]
MRTWPNFRLPYAALVLAIIFLSLITAATTSAHAYIVRTSPAADATIQTPPAAIDIWFTEPIQAPPHAIVVTGPSGNQLQQGQAKVSSSDSTELTVPIKSGANGTYTVEWHAISADTHPVGGTYQFSVGAPSATPVKASNGSAGSTSDGTTAFAAFSRWLLLIGLMAIVGPLAYLVVVLGDTTDPPIERRLWKMVLVGAIIAVVAAPVMFIAQAEGVAGSIGGAFNGSLLRDLLTGIYGQRWIARTVLSLLILGLVIWRLLYSHRPGWIVPLRWRPRFWPVAGLILAAALMVFTSLNGHAATTKPVWLSVLFDWLHLGAAAVWIGGLVAFVVAILPRLKCRSASESVCLLGRVVPRFSTVALVCVEVLIVTGLYATWAHVGGTALLTSTGYGKTLLVKLGLVAIVLGFAAVNLLVTRPKLVRAGSDEPDGPDAVEVVRRFRRLTSVEAFLGIVILAVVGVLTSLAPAETPPTIAAATPPAPPPLTLAHNAGSNLVVLSL